VKQTDRKLLNICLFGGPGTGKSTISTGVFHQMKKEGYSIEYVPEYAKDLTYSKDHFKIKDQVMILAKQSHPWFKLEGQVDYTVNDGPFFLGLVYLQDNPHLPKEEFKNLLVSMWKSYHTINIFLERNLEEHGYQEYGRNQTLEEAIQKDKEIKQTLEEYGIDYYSVEMSEDAVSKIIEIVESRTT